jgi:hypothetical protein
VRYDKETYVQEPAIPIEDYAYTIVNMTDRATGKHFQAIELLMHHGRYVNIVWTSSLARRLTTVSAAQRTATRAIAVVTAQRMAQL